MDNCMSTFLRMNGTNRAYPFLTPTQKYAVFCIFIVIGEDADDTTYHQFPSIPYNDYPVLRGVSQVVATNIGGCISLSCISILAYVFTSLTMKLLGCKGRFIYSTKYGINYMVRLG